MTVNTTLLGGGFGRKSKPDYIVEAAVCSQRMNGAPVKVIWTREDDIQQLAITIRYRQSISKRRSTAMGAQRLGCIEVWRPASARFSCRASYTKDRSNWGWGWSTFHFRFLLIRCENGEAEAHARIGWCRSVSNIPHAFAVQSFAAELAHAAGRDFRDYLLEVDRRSATNGNEAHRGLLELR